MVQNPSFPIFQEVQVRPIILAYAAVCKLSSRFLKLRWLKPWTKRIFIDCLRAGYQAWVLANKQEIAAHGVMSVAVEECHLLALCVHPVFQRMGYGRKLFTLLLDRAASLDAKACFLEVRVSNDRAISLCLLYTTDAADE